MNVDVGGGTSKVAIVQGGKVIDTCAVEVGARLIAMDENGVINRLEDTALKIAKMAGIDGLKLGGRSATSKKINLPSASPIHCLPCLSAASWRRRLRTFCSRPISTSAIRSTR